MSLNLSVLTAHSLFLFLKHFSQAIQPRIAVPPTLTISVSQPAARSSLSTSLRSNSVFPPFRGLPFMATTYIVTSLFLLVYNPTMIIRSSHSLLLKSKYSTSELTVKEKYSSKSIVIFQSISFLPDNIRKCELRITSEICPLLISKTN